MNARTKKVAPKNIVAVAPSYSEIATFTGEKVAADVAEAWDEVSQFAAENKERLLKAGVIAGAFAAGYALATSI